MFLPDNLKINDKNHLEIGGCDTVELAAKYGTPLYVMDAGCIVGTIMQFKAALEEYYPNSLLCYASKAFCVKGMFSLLNGAGADVASGGELYTALSAGADVKKIYFHGNNKSEEEIAYAVKSGVHAIVIDNLREIETVRAQAKKQGVTQGVMLRINVGIEAHTHKFIQTASVDSKFGIPPHTALQAAKSVAEGGGLEFLGLHCHVGSQVFETRPFVAAVHKMVDIILECKKSGIIVKELNMGGGYGVAYTVSDKPLSIDDYMRAICLSLESRVQLYGIEAPKLIIEAGRSIVASAGITLHSIGAIKRVQGIRNYLSVDGGLFENPRYTMYQARYHAVLCNRAGAKADNVFTIAGKCCEADTLIESVMLPEPVCGDILAVLCTGAYNYAMASNYNRNPMPPVVAVMNGKSGYMVEPQTYSQIASRDKFPINFEE